MSTEHSSKPQTASPAAARDGVKDSAVNSAEWKVLEAGSLLAQFGSFGLIWMNKDLTVEDTFGPLVQFATVGTPITECILPLLGLEQDILALHRDTRQVLELPAVAVMSGPAPTSKINFTLFWNAGRDCPMALAYKSASQTELEYELSKQIRARLMAEAEVIAKSKELARANADLESFAAIISHDLKAPLRHMRQMTEAAFDRADGIEAGALRDILRDIDAQSRRMSHMLTALLDYSTLGRKYEAIEPVDTRALIEAIRNSMPENGVRVDIAGQWPTVATLRAPLDLVLRNLVGNALQHHDRMTGVVTLSCTDQQHMLRFAVTDDGPGIEPQHHNSIFMPFRTLKSGADGGSTGIGLAAVKKTVEGVGGTIEVVSNPAVARGTTFMVYWPKAVRT